jgi:hypothetical protein
MVTLIVDH